MKARIHSPLGRLLLLVFSALVILSIGAFLWRMGHGGTAGFSVAAPIAGASARKLWTKLPSSFQQKIVANLKSLVGSLTRKSVVPAGVVPQNLKGVVFMTPTSLAVTPAQPDKQTYGTAELALFKLFTRESYRAAFGVSAPAFDAGRPVKRWFDSSAANDDQMGDVVVYKTIQRVGEAYANKQMVLLSGIAATVNIPGSPSFPPYVVAPTTATRTAPGNLAPQPLNPFYLSSREDADKLAAELSAASGTNVSVAEEADLGGGFGTHYPGDESRRLFEVVLNGRNLNVGALLMDRNDNGVGSPGIWKLVPGSDPDWIPTTPSTADPGAAETAVPMRALLPNEKLVITLMGVVVERIDKEPAGQTAGDGNFTTGDRATLRAIAGVVGAQVS